MKILVIGDLHGKMPSIKEKDFDCIVVIGDVCSDEILGPLYRGFFMEDDIKGSSVKLLEYITLKVGGAEKLDGAYEESLEVGRGIMEYLDSFGKPIFMVAGNWDASYGKTRIKDMQGSNYSEMKSFYDYWLGDRINPELIRGLSNVRDCMFRCHEFGGVNFVGYGLSSGPEDFDVRRKKKGFDGLTDLQVLKLKAARKKIWDKLRGAYRTRKNKKLPGFFISHNVPHGGKLDVVRKKGSYVNGKHLGSTIARDFCLKMKPMICVGGHIHEGRGKEMIGGAVALNTGMGQVLIEVDEGKGRIKKVRFL